MTSTDQVLWSELCRRSKLDFEVCPKIDANGRARFAERGVYLARWSLAWLVIGAPVVGMMLLGAAWLGRPFAQPGTIGLMLFIWSIITGMCAVRVAVTLSRCKSIIVGPDCVQVQLPAGSVFSYRIGQLDIRQHTVVMASQLRRKYAIIAWTPHFAMILCIWPDASRVAAYGERLRQVSVAVRICGGRDLLIMNK